MPNENDNGCAMANMDDQGGPEKFLDQLIVSGIEEVLGKTPLVEASFLDEIVIVKRWCTHLCPLLYSDALPLMYQKAGLNKIGLHDVVRVGDIMFEFHALDCLRKKCMTMDEFREQLPLPFDPPNPHVH